MHGKASKKIRRGYKVVKGSSKVNRKRPRPAASRKLSVAGRGRTTKKGCDTKTRAAQFSTGQKLDLSSTNGAVQAFFDDELYKNWLRVVLALRGTWEAMAPVVDKIMINYQLDLKDKLREGSKDELIAEVLKQHRQPISVPEVWKRSDVDKWFSDREGPREIAKVFMPKGSGRTNSFATGNRSDMTGMLKLFTCFMPFERYISDFKQLLRVIQIRNKTLHSLGMKYSQDELEYCFQEIRTLLNDKILSQHLAQFPNFKKSVTDIDTAKSTDLSIDAVVNLSLDVLEERLALQSLDDIPSTTALAANREMLRKLRVLLNSKDMESIISKEDGQEKLGGLESLINVQQTLADEKMSMLFRKDQLDRLQTPRMSVELGAKRQSGAVDPPLIIDWYKRKKLKRRLARHRFNGQNILAHSGKDNAADSLGKKYLPVSSRTRNSVPVVENENHEVLNLRRNKSALDVPYHKRDEEVDNFSNSENLFPAPSTTKLVEADSYTFDLDDPNLEDIEHKIYSYSDQSFSANLPFSESFYPAPSTTKFRHGHERAASMPTPGEINLDNINLDHINLAHIDQSNNQKDYVVSFSISDDLFPAPSSTRDVQDEEDMDSSHKPDKKKSETENESHSQVNDADNVSTSQVSFSTVSSSRFGKTDENVPSSQTLNNENLEMEAQDNQENDKANTNVSQHSLLSAFSSTHAQADARKSSSHDFSNEDGVADERRSSSLVFDDKDMESQKSRSRIDVTNRFSTSESFANSYSSSTIEQASEDTSMSYIPDDSSLKDRRHSASQEGSTATFTVSEGLLHAPSSTTSKHSNEIDERRSNSSLRSYQNLENQSHSEDPRNDTVTYSFSENLFRPPSSIAAQQADKYASSPDVLEDKNPDNKNQSDGRRDNEANFSLSEDYVIASSCTRYVQTEECDSCPKEPNDDLETANRLYSQEDDAAHSIVSENVFLALSSIKAEQSIASISNSLAHDDENASDTVGSVISGNFFTKPSSTVFEQAVSSTKVDDKILKDRNYEISEGVFHDASSTRLQLADDERTSSQKGQDSRGSSSTRIPLADERRSNSKVHYGGNLNSESKLSVRMAYGEDHSPQERVSLSSLNLSVSDEPAQQSAMSLESCTKAAKRKSTTTFAHYDFTKKKALVSESQQKCEDGGNDNDGGDTHQTMLDIRIQKLQSGNPEGFSTGNGHYQNILKGILGQQFTHPYYEDKKVGLLHSSYVRFRCRYAVKSGEPRPTTIEANKEASVQALKKFGLQVPDEKNAKPVLDQFCKVSTGQNPNYFTFPASATMYISVVQLNSSSANWGVRSNDDVTSHVNSTVASNDGILLQVRTFDNAQISREEKEENCAIVALAQSNADVSDITNVKRAVNEMCLRQGGTLPVYDTTEIGETDDGFVATLTTMTSLRIEKSKDNDRENAKESKGKTHGATEDYEPDDVIIASSSQPSYTRDQSEDLAAKLLLEKIGAPIGNLEIEGLSNPHAEVLRQNATRWGYHPPQYHTFEITPSIDFGSGLVTVVSSKAFQETEETIIAESDGALESVQEARESAAKRALMMLGYPRTFYARP